MTELNLNGYTALPRGKIAAVVTYLEMRERPAPAEPSQHLSLRRVVAPDLAWYRGLYAAVGLDWLWTSRLAMSEAALAAVLHRPGTELFVADGAAADVGMAELDRRDPAEVEIVFFGLRKEALGRGLGRAMMAEALRHAWAGPTRRVWLHTCTLDHPAALGFYRRCGFVPYARAVEVIDDPRLAGQVPRTAAPQVPVIG